MTSFGYRLNPRYVIKQCSSCGTLYTRDCSCSKGNVEDKILIPKPPKNCARCGHPVDGPYCQGCALLRKELEEDLVTHFQDSQNTSESSVDNTNLVNALRETFVVKQDQGSFVDKLICDLHTFSPNQRHCFHCKDVLRDGFDQTQPPQSPVIHPPPQETSIKILHDQEKVINSVQIFLRKFNHYSFFETPKVLLLAWDRVFKIKDAFGNEQYKPEDVQDMFYKLLNDVQNIHEELAEYINTPGWNRPTFYNNGDDDDVDYTIAITSVLSTEEPDNSLSIGDEHLDTIPATESDKVIWSSVEDLVLIPSESKVMMTLYYENIEYVEASPHDSELVSLEVENIVISEDEDIEDDNLREKLLKVNLLISKIKALKDNPTPSSEFLTKSSSTYPKSVLEETNTFDNSVPEFENFCFDLEEISSGSATTHSDISLPEYESLSFYDDHIEEISSGSTTTQSDSTHEEFGDEPAHIISPPEYDCFYFRNLPDPGKLISSLNSEIRENLSSTTRVNLPIKDDYSPLLAYVVWIFLAYLTYPIIPPHLYSFGNEDTIFDPGITINRFYSSKPGLSHQCGTFKKFNTHRSHLNESPMEIFFSTLFLMDQ
nr:hypothetical protein [Tanacetum cinerariifolium]